MRIRTAGAVKVLLAPDAGPGVGGGHVMRCLTLAGALAAQGATCVFLTRPETGPLLDLFDRQGFERVPAGPGGSAEFVAACRQAADRLAVDAVVIDHYGIDAEGDASLRRRGRRLVALEDLGRDRACDLVSDPARMDGPEGAPAAGARLDGPRYALVRDEFRDVRARALRRRRRRAQAMRILVSLGLSDPGGLSARVGLALLDGVSRLEVRVILGPSAASLGPLQAAAAGDRRLEVIRTAPDMARHCAWADLAVGAGGSSQWERCVVGLPAVTLVLADNQAPNAAALERAGAGVALRVGPDLDRRLADTVRGLLEDPAQLRAMSRSAARICDGRGASRLAARILAVSAAT